MHYGHNLIQFSIKKPKLVTTIMVVAALLIGSLILKVQVDTDPENMLSETEQVRVFHNQVKKDFSLYDVVVLGVVNEKDPDGVFNPATLKNVHELTEFARTITDPEDPKRTVVSRDIIAPGNVDTIEQAGIGQVRFEWLMQEPPATREEALKIRDSAMSNPLLKGTLISEDGKALCIYLPITEKDFAHDVRVKLMDKIASLDAGNGDDFHITGLPVAEDTFGVEMFIQMAVSAPLAMLAIFLLMLLFFKKMKLIIAPMIIAMVSVVITMGLLIGTGNTVHIMSSMIPIFLMPIAVVDSIHILSEFFDSYQLSRDRRKTIEDVMGHLFMPMLYTSLTSSAGFASLALTPIPPVQVFGLFVASGIMLAWFLTIVFVPAYIMMMSEESLDNFGVATADSAQPHDTFLSRHLRWLGGVTFRQAKVLLAITGVILCISAYGISKIQINDNPIKWFSKSHPIRQADRILNHHFGGTYEAYLVLEGVTEELNADKAAELTRARIKSMLIDDADSAITRQAVALIAETLPQATSTDDFFSQLSTRYQDRQYEADDHGYDLWARLLDTLDQVRNRDQVFKNPEVLRYIAKLQNHIQQSGVVGKSNSITDVVKKVHQELFAGKTDHFTVPETTNGVAQCLISYQNSHKPDDLFHFITPGYQKANIWVQLKSGDNKDMEAVVKKTELFFASNPPPVELKHQWAGLTYLNVVWQDKMVTGMLESFMGSFVIVFIMMAFLFRSLFWGLLAMVPLSVTIAFIYGLIGIIGKDYDMPVAVLSSLTLGMAVDFAIHFLERTRATVNKCGSWKEGIKEMFEEPARAITRNVIVIAIGFTPLLAAPLIPYKTVGIFLATIMAISGLGTMFILPALITVFERWLFRKNPAPNQEKALS